MARLSLLKSVVTRLVGALAVGGVIITVGLTFLEFRRAEALLQMDLSQEAARTTRSMQGALEHFLNKQDRDEIRHILTLFATGSRVRAVRLTGSTFDPIDLGDWPQSARAEAFKWWFPERAVSAGTEVRLDQLTLLQAPFRHGDSQYVVELLLDGPSIHGRMIEQAVDKLWAQWLFMGVMTLLGLLMLRRWFGGPLSLVMKLIHNGAGPGPFNEMADQYAGEFSQLAGAIGEMLTRLDATTEQLRHRERALANLYQFAPAPMVSLDHNGQIVEANRRAAELFGVGTEQTLVGRSVMDFVQGEDRGVLRHAIDRLEVDDSSRCEIRVFKGTNTIDTMVECSGLRDEEDGQLHRVRLSLLDVSRSKDLQRELANKSRLMNLVIDHMSDAILLVDRNGRIAAHNRRLAALLHRRPDGLINQRYDPEMFWEEMGVLRQEFFLDRMRQIETEQNRPAQERFETRVGTFLFQGIPVQDAAGQSVGKLWVVQEITPQEQNEKLLEEQTSQLQALKHIGQQLCDVQGVEDLLVRAGQLLYEVMHVEAIGVVLRHDRRGIRSQQILHRGGGSYLLEPNRALIASVERYLMPQILTNHDVTFWSDLPRATQWAKDFNQAGLTCLAGATLRGRADIQGIVWIARRGGERLERHHIYLLEALAPMIAARLEIAQLREQLQSVELSDGVTELPNREQFNRMVQKHINRPGHPWAVVTLNLDHFKKVNDQLGHDKANELLREVAGVLLRACRRSEFLARLEGPTFGVICPEASRQHVVALAERLRKVIATQHAQMPDGQDWPLTASAGVAAFPEDHLDPTQIVPLAEARTEIARRSGRDRVVAEGTISPGKQVG